MNTFVFISGTLFLCILYFPLFCSGYYSTDIKYDCRKYCHRQPCNESFPEKTSYDFQKCNRTVIFCNSNICPPEQRNSNSKFTAKNVTLFLLAWIVLSCFILLARYACFGDLEHDNYRYNQTCWDFFQPQPLPTTLVSGSNFNCDSSNSPGVRSLTDLERGGERNTIYSNPGNGQNNSQQHQDRSQQPSSSQSNTSATSLGMNNINTTNINTNAPNSTINNSSDLPPEYLPPPAYYEVQR